MNSIEMLDLVDKDDNVLGTYSRDHIYINGLIYVRVVEVFIRNSKGELWIPIRRLDKRIAPGGFDIGAGGHIEHGETENDAFRKEVIEEIGWNIDDVKWSYIGKYGPNEGLNTVSFIYEIEQEVAPELSKDDFTASEWMSPIVLATKIKEGHPAKSNILPLLKLVYGVY